MTTALDIGPIFMRRAPAPLPARRPLPMVDGKRPKQPPLARPDRPPVLRKADWAQLDTALALAAEGMEDVGRQLLADLERRVGVTVHDRIVWAGHTNVAGAEEAAARVRSEGKRLRFEQREQRLRAEALRSDRHLPPTASILEDIEAAQYALAAAVHAHQRGDVEESRTQRARAKELQDSADAARARQLETEDQRRAAADRELLAAERGEMIITEDFDMKVPVLIDIAGGTAGQMLVERLQRVVRVRNVTRDGLASMRTARLKQEAEVAAGKRKKATGGLTLRQYQAGIRYRTMYENHDGGLGSQMGRLFNGSRSKGAVVITAGEASAIAKRCDQRAALDKLEAEVSASDRTGQRLHLLREVAGKGRNIREVVSGGAARHRAGLRLAAALDVVVEHLHHTKA